MARKRKYTAEQIITKLREVEIYLGQGKTVVDVKPVIRHTLRDKI